MTRATKLRGAGLATLLLLLAPACSSSPAIPADYGTGGAGGAPVLIEPFPEFPQVGDASVHGDGQPTVLG